MIKIKPNFNECMEFKRPNFVGVKKAPHLYTNNRKHQARMGAPFKPETIPMFLSKRKHNKEKKKFIEFSKIEKVLDEGHGY